MRKLLLSLLFVTLGVVAAYAQVPPTAAARMTFTQTCPIAIGQVGNVILSGKLNFKPLTGTYTVTVADCGAWLEFTLTATGQILNLPSTASLNSAFASVPAPSNTPVGFYIATIKNDAASTFPLTITPNGTQTIDGQATASLAAGSGIAIVFDGTNWKTAP
jgi:hypothetical protein